jgi:tRNA(Arg) A34 adenosine deaminase TadA
MKKPSGELVLRLPPWLTQQWAESRQPSGSVEDRMRFVISLARQNVERGTGGPFGAAVFEVETGRMLGVGVNVVLASNCSIAHAEMVALGLAQQTAGTHTLSSPRMRTTELVTSVEPCAMCLGAIPWSGVRRLVCGADGQDACEIGFDEGAKVADWVGVLRDRGIETTRHVLRDEARAVLQDYAARGGTIYNGAGPP